LSAGFGPGGFAPAMDAGGRLVAMVDAEINRQALMIAHIDDFYLMMIVSLVALPLLLLIRKGRKSANNQAVVMD
jgi:DHA2 family multidrug resistance protein